MASAVEAALGFAKSTRRTFHDVPYVLAISGDSEGLAIEVEHAEDGRRWRSRFPARFIEEITQRTGNAKKFDVFVRMLLSALVQESDSVYLDVLTARDLEMLRRHANPQGPPTTSTAGQSDKRYLILTYRAEFDKVHYPLPLPLEERSEEETLRALVARLRVELVEAKSHNLHAAGAQEHTTGATFLHDDERVVSLQRQNLELGEAVRAAQREVEVLRAEVRLGRGSAPSSSSSHDLADLQKQKDKVRSLQAELKASQDRAKEKESRWKKEVETLAWELKAERQKVDRLQQQVRRLEEERRAAASRPGAGAGRPLSGERSRAASRSASAERARPPSRTPSASRTPPPASRQPPGPPSRSRPSSRASSAASSRERTPSPGGFGRSDSSQRAAAERSGAFQRSGSPGAWRGSRRGSSPGATLSPYRQSAEPPRRAPSPGQRGGREGSLPPVQPGRTQVLSLRERSGSGGLRDSSPVLAPAKPLAQRYGGGGSGGSRAGSAAPRAPSAGVPRGGAAAEEREAGRHRPGSLFGLAADLGLGPSAGGAAAAAAARGGLASAAAAAEVPDASDIDARLQALQSFLKQTKHISG